MLKFEVVARCGAARAGVLTTAHGQVETPAFMPVATRAVTKALSPDEVAASGTRLLVMNTYHLWLRPGAELVAAHGGLHGFSRWPHAIATDSGGYQAFSLAQRTQLTEEGFQFASHLDGTRHLLTPEESMRVQGLLNADLAMQLDVCPAAGATSAELRSAVDRTERWGRRCLAARNAGQALFGIVQGGLDVRLRLAHADAVAKEGFDGIALGGFSVGEDPEQMHAVLTQLGPQLDPARPRYLMGVGTLSDLARAISNGVDLFDCVLPTRNARAGQVFTRRGKIVIKNARHARDLGVLEEGCECPTCRGGYSRAYLRHLFMAEELLVYRLLSLHNLHVYRATMARARQAILSGDYPEFVRGLDSKPKPGIVSGWVWPKRSK